MNDEEKYARAKKRVEALRGFYLHALIFAAVMPPLVIWNIYLPQTWWVQWPLLGWGIGVLGHGLSVYGHEPLGQAWQERKISEVMAKM